MEKKKDNHKNASLKRKILIHQMPEPKKGNPHRHDVRQFSKNIPVIETKIFRYASEIVQCVIAGSAGAAWHDYFDLLQTRFGWVYTHSINVAILSVMMAAESGFNKKELEDVALGGLLHDIGKILIPTSIIQKKSSLDKAQMDIVRKHCELGMSLVAGCGLTDGCHAMILQHHERLDGSGYPFGLKSGGIHPSSKIAMIADVLDAITSDRPYRPAKSVAEAFAIIKAEGAKFSAEYVSMIKRLCCEYPA